MAAKWIEFVTGSLADKKAYRRYKARIAALPEPYATAAKAFERYFMYNGGITDGDPAVMMTMLSDRNRLAIAFGTHGGCIRANNAWKPIPIAMHPRLVRTQPAKVRSLARSVLSSARSVAEKSSIAWSIPDQRFRPNLVPLVWSYCDCF